MVVTFQWSEEYSIHDSVIDEEHKKLLYLANEIFAISNPSRERERFTVALKQLFGYMEYHFRHEEQLMSGVVFPDRQAHSARHNEIIVQMNTLLKSCRSLGKLSEKLKDFMRDWVLKHIAEEDKRIAASVVASELPDSPSAVTSPAATPTLPTGQGWAFLGPTPNPS